MRRAPQVYNNARRSDRVIELQNWIVIILTGVVVYYNAERVRLSRINNYQNAANSKTTNEILNEIKKIDNKIKS